MKLNTNRIFGCSKKPIHSSSKKVKFFQSNLTKSTKSNASNRETNNSSNQKSDKKSKPCSPNKNPFNGQLTRTVRLKNRTHQKTKSTKEQNVHLKWSKNNEVSEFNAELSNKKKSKEKDEELDIETLCKLFHSSKLNKAIILDNNGNNNLSPDQKKMINVYFDKKEKLGKNIKNCNINSIKVQNYNHNNILLKENNTMQNNNNNLKYNTLNCDNEYNTQIYEKNVKRIKNYKGHLSSKVNYRFKGPFLDFCKRKLNEEQKNMNEEYDKENNSIFENCTNISLDSSFLGSILDENFLDILD